MVQKKTEASGSGDTYTPDSYSQIISSKFPKEDLRPWGRQLYAFLGIFYLPRVIDMMWVFMMGGHQYIQPVTNHVKHQKEECWKEVPVMLIGLVLGLVPVLIFSAFTIVFNLVCALLNVRYYLLHITESSMVETSINGEEVWEVTVFQKEARPSDFSFTPYVADKVKVAFGPFEYWCLFRKQTQSDATARSPSPA